MSKRQFLLNLIAKWLVMAREADETVIRRGRFRAACEFMRDYQVELISKCNT